MGTRAKYRGGERCMEVYQWVLHDYNFHVDLAHTVLCWGGGGITHVLMELEQSYDGHS